MWNYNFVIPSILVLLIFMLYYFIRPRLPIRMNYTFLNLLMVDIFTILFDFVSSKADEAHLRFSVPLLYFLNLGYFVFYLARIFWFYLFTLDVLNLHGKPRRWIYQLTPLVFAFSELVTLSSPITHAVFSIDAEGYHRGPLYNILYVCSFFYIFAALVMLITYCKGLSPFDLLSWPATT